MFSQHSEKQAIFCISSNDLLYDSQVLATNHFILRLQSISRPKENAMVHH